MPEDNRYPVLDEMESMVGSWELRRATELQERCDLLGEEEKQVLSLIREIATAMVRGVGELAALDGAPAMHRLFPEINQYVRTSDEFRSVFDLIDEEVCLWLAWDACGIARAAQERFWQLFPCAQLVTPGPRAVAFLKRVSRCYLLGLDAECVVMCRAVLDAEFDAEISNDDCISKLGQPRRRQGRNDEPFFHLDDKIVVARLLNRITTDSEQLAHHVRKLGNAVVHQNPDIRVEPIQVIAKTLVVIGELCDSHR